jgi:hypothetical protein
VSSNTLGTLHAWQDQFIICGIVGLVVGVIALFGLKELAPSLRDQLMVSMKDRALLEARAAGIDIAESLKHPFRQVMKLDVIGSAFGISVFLIFYYSAVGFFTVYFTTQHGYSLSQANSIGDWFWGLDALGLIIVGIISDKLRVRKPFMLVGGIGAIVMTIVFLNVGATASYGTLAIVISLTAIFMAIAYAPWMASFTETVEKHNPALTATGLAVWGLIIRVVIAVSVFVIPFVIRSMTPLVQYGTPVATLSAKYAPELATLKAIDPKTIGTLQANPADATAGATAVGEVVKAFNITPAAATARLTATATVPKADLAFLQAHGNDVATAAAQAPGQWKAWWWVCVGGEILFLPFVLLMAGRWSPKKAREDAEEHEAAIQRELESLGAES